ncbi:MAG: PEGA domain-containing protein, partial [Vicinamibacteraceae bacterium]|nr:PEGA domain-containing protein [Vicinamibacteraceae bacterium]
PAGADAGDADASMAAGDCSAESEPAVGLDAVVSADVVPEVVSTSEAASSTVGLDTMSPEGVDLSAVMREEDTPGDEGACLAVSPCEWLAEATRASEVPPQGGESHHTDADGDVASEVVPAPPLPVEEAPPAVVPEAVAPRGPATEAVPVRRGRADRVATRTEHDAARSFFGVLDESDTLPGFEPAAEPGSLVSGTGSEASAQDGAGRRRVWLVAAAVTCVVALAGVAWHWRAPEPSAEPQADTGASAGEATSPPPLAGRAAPGAPRGGLRIITMPAGTRAIVDGVDRGTTPITVDDLAPGDHAVVVENAANRVERRVTVDEGTTADLEIPVSGRLLVSSPLPVEIYDRGRWLGASATRRLEVAAGRRRLEVVNETVAYRESFDVEVPAGGTARLEVNPPNGLLHLSADEPASVSIDGREVGTTPVNGVTVPLGEHRITFTHEQFGEQTYTVLVTLNSPSRLRATFVPPRPRLPRPVRRR